MKNKGGSKGGATIPVAPFIKYIERALLENDFGTVAQIIWPDDQKNSAERRLARLLNETKNTSFDVGDEILCKLACGAMTWRNDPELREIYLSYNLNALDLVQPVNEAVGEQSREWVASLVRESGTVIAVVRQTGIDRGTIKRALAQVAA